MVGLFVQQHYLPFFPGCFSENERFQATKAEALATQWFSKNGKFEEQTKGKIASFTDFIKSMKNEQGNSSVSEVQDLINGSKILNLKWKNSTCITLVLADGTIVYIRIKNLFSNEFYCIVDKFFKFPEPAMDVAYSDRHVLFLFPDNRILLLRKDEIGLSGSKSDLIQPEVTVNSYPELLPSMASKRVAKKVSLNDKSDLFMIWWSGSKDDVFPWSPKPEQRANILIYSLEESDPVLLSYLKTDNTLLDSAFVQGKYNNVCTLEQNCDSQGNIMVNEVIHEITRGKLTALCETAIPLHSELKCYAYDERQRKLALGCCDSSIVVYTQDGKVTHYTKASFIPCSVKWHNDSYILFIVGDRGQFQIFDIALSPLLLVDNFDSSPSLSKELMIPSSPIDYLSWSPLQPSSTDSCLLIRFEVGAMILLRLAVGRMRLSNICNFHLTNYHYPEAVKVLKSVYWNSEECLHVMFNIFTFLMQQKHCDEVEYNLEHLLATYFVPSVPIEDKLRKRHAKSMRILARKFFMWLLRAKKFPRAFQIAISLGEEGLLRKLHGAAHAYGELVLAAEISKRLKSTTVHSSSDSHCGSSGSCSESACSCGSSSETSCDGENENETLSPVSVTIPKYTNNISNVLVLEPPSPYRNPTVEQPPPVPKTFYFGENFKAAIEGGGDSGGAGVSGTNNSSSVENALISDAGTFENKTDAMDEIKGSQKIEVVHFGQV